MKRRAFLQVGGVGSAMVAALAGGPSGLSAATLVANPPDEMEIIRKGAHRLGRLPQTSTERLIVGLSDSVFRRLCEALEGRSYRMTECQHVGDLIGRSDAITEGWQCGFILNLSYASEHASPPFELYDDFVAATSGWTRGPTLDTSPGGVSPLVAFGDKRAVGLPILPCSLVWAGHYVDERTGMAMRAAAQHEIMYDHVVCRWDVICG